MVQSVWYWMWEERRMFSLARPTSTERDTIRMTMVIKKNDAAHNGIPLKLYPLGRLRHKDCKFKDSLTTY